MKLLVQSVLLYGNTMISASNLSIQANAYLNLIRANNEDLPRLST